MVEFFERFFISIHLPVWTISYSSGVNLLGRDLAGGVQEIIEVAPTKDRPYRHTKKKFNRFIKPPLYPILSYCIQLTSHIQKQIDEAKSFKK